MATLIVAPQTTEFATKVGILGALVLVCACRPLLERWFPVRSPADSLTGGRLRALTSGHRIAGAKAAPAPPGRGGGVGRGWGGRREGTNNDLQRD